MNEDKTISLFDRLVKALEGIELLCIGCGKKPEIIDVMNLKYPYLCDTCKKKEIQNSGAMKNETSV